MLSTGASLQQDPSFENFFHIEDLSVFDTDTIHSMLAYDHTSLTTQLLAHSMHGVSTALMTHISQSLPDEQQPLFQQELRRSLTHKEVVDAQQQVLNDLFWELIYWKTPELYEALTEGERLHPGIFQSLEADLRDKVVLDAGAGSGRATFDCAQLESLVFTLLSPRPACYICCVTKSLSVMSSSALFLLPVALIPCRCPIILLIRLSLVPLLQLLMIGEESRAWLN